MKSVSLFILLISQIGFAQKNRTDTLQPYQSNLNAATSNLYAEKIIRKKCIKWNYSLLARGVFLMNHEFFVRDKVSGEVGLGVTYRDPIFELLNLHPYKFRSNAASPYNNTVMHLCAEAGIRYYPQTFDNFNGFYISPTISYRYYSFKDPLRSGLNGGIPYSYNAGYSLLDFQFKLGFQNENFWKSHRLTDVYIGLALRYATIDQLAETRNGPAYIATYQAITTNISYTVVLLGFKIGLPF
jgi:hypothetical protein